MILSSQRKSTDSKKNCALLSIRLKNQLFGDDLACQVPRNFFKIKILRRYVGVKGTLKDFLFIARSVPERGILPGPVEFPGFSEYKDRNIEFVRSKYHLQGACFINDDIPAHLVRRKNQVIRLPHHLSNQRIRDQLHLVSHFSQLNRLDPPFFG